MSDKELIQALQGAAVETGSILCLGCGHEYSCGTRGCAIIRAAAERLEELTAPPNTPLGLEELREMDGEPVWVIERNNYPPRWGLVYWYRKNKRDIVYVTINNGASIRVEAFIADGGEIYRRKPEERAK